MNKEFEQATEIRIRRVENGWMVWPESPPSYAASPFMVAETLTALEEIVADWAKASYRRADPLALPADKMIYGGEIVDRLVIHGQEIPIKRTDDPEIVRLLCKVMYLVPGPVRLDTLKAVLAGKHHGKLELTEADRPE